MSTIASLVVKLTAETNPLTKGLSTATAAVGKAAGSISSMGSGFGSIFSAITGPIGLAIGAITSVGASLKAAGDHSAAIKRLDAVLAATGNTTGLTRDQMTGLADELEKTTNFGHTATIGAEAMLATFEGIRGDTFKGALKSAQDLAAFTGEDLKSSVEKVGRALENPARGIKMLGREGLLSPAQMASIDALNKAGNTAGAQAAILDALKGKIGGMAEAMSSPFTRFKNQLLGIAENVGAILKPLIRIGLDIVTPFVDHIGKGIASIVPVAERVFGWLGGVVKTGFRAIADFVFDVWGRVANFIDTTLVAALDYLAEPIASFGDLMVDAWTGYTQIISAAFSAIWDGIVFLAQGIGEALAAVGITFGTAGKSAGSFGEYLQATLIVLEFAWTHWKEVGEFVLLGFVYGIVQLANETAYYFGVIGQWLAYVGRYWGTTFTNMANLTSVVAQNIWTNLSNLWTAIEGIFSGDGFQFTWKPLTEGFRGAIAELPRIAERQIGPLESSLKQQVQSLGQMVDRDFNKFADERTKKIADQAAFMRGKLHKEGLIGLIPKLPDAAKLANKIAKPGDQLLGGQTGAGSKIGALVKGSEDAFKAAHEQKSMTATLVDFAGKQLNVLQKIAAQGGDNDGGDDMVATI